MKTKRLSRIRVKDADQGLVEAVFATLDAIDADKDVTVPGAFTDSEAVRISAYGHASWSGALPVGRGTIREKDGEAILEGQFFLNTQAGRDTFEVVKEMGDLQEWSYGYDVLEEKSGEFEGESVRFLQKLKVYEVSPVLLGAGVDTRTLAVKGAKAWAEMAGSYEATTEALRTAIERDLTPDDLGDDEYAYVSIQGTFADRVVATFRRTGSDSVTYQYGWSVSDQGEVTLSDRTEVDLTVTVREKDLQWAEHSERVLLGVKVYTDRAAALAALRVKEGRVLSAANRERLEGLALALREAASGLDQLLSDTDPDDEKGSERDDVQREFLRFVALKQAS